MRITNYLPRLWSNWISLTGTILATVAGCVLLLALASSLILGGDNVYFATFALLIGPAIFIAGLLLIPIGQWFERRRKRDETEDEASLREGVAKLLENPVLRRRILFIALMTVGNILLLGTVGHQAVEFMDTPRFCGTVCHNVMQPEYTAYQRSPHSRVPCVACHIGSGASAFVKSKVDGLRQVWGVLTGDFARPVETPVRSLRPSRDTCERCHWPTKFHGNRILHTVHYDTDRDNSRTDTVMLLHVGGANPRANTIEGIHWHVNPRIEIRYEALDAKRAKVGKVSVFRDGKLLEEFEAPAASSEDGDEQAAEATVHELRTMDCVDCHNRPTHRYDGSPSDALDHGLSEGLLDPKVPFLKAMALPILSKEDTPRDQAEVLFEQQLRAAYEAKHKDAMPSDEALAEAAKGMAALYRRNVFPYMHVGWDTYPRHIGHRGNEMDTFGCFRCHDDEHATKSGKTISQDCDLCHTSLAEDEALDELSDEVKALISGSGGL